MNIIELARQAKGAVWPRAKSVVFTYDELERFAALVRAEERERIATVMDHCEDHERAAYYAAAIRGMK